MKLTPSGNLEISDQLLNQSQLYTDRNGVYHKAKVEYPQQIREHMMNLADICKGRFNVISNESEDPKSKVLNVDRINGIHFDDDEYVLSTQSAAEFIRDRLGYDTCYFVGTDEVAQDVKAMGLKTINLVEVNQIKYLKGFFNKDYPILYARSVFPITARCKNQKDVEWQTNMDFGLSNVMSILKNSDSKVVFAHTKPNCQRVIDGEEIIELNLGYYFDYILKKMGLKVGDRIFDLGKGGSSKGEIFDLALRREGIYDGVIGIGDMISDISHVVDNDGLGILVRSGDQVMDDAAQSWLKQREGRVFVIDDVSKILIG